MDHNMSDREDWTGAPLSRREFVASCLCASGSLALGTTAMSRAKDEPTPVDPVSRKLPQRVLGRTGVKVSILGMGGAWFMSATKDKEAALMLLNRAIDGGINFFDTSRGYINSEDNMGLVLAKRRKEVFLATKIDQRTYDGALQDVEQSLKALQTDHIDLIQIHYVFDGDKIEAFGRKDGFIRALERLRDEKVIRFIGLTGHPNYRTVAAALEMYDCWDTFLGFANPLLATRPMYETQLPIAQKKKMGVIAMKVFGGGDPCSLVGDGPGKASASVLLRYALSQMIAVAIPAVSTIKQLDENLKVAQTFMPLSEEEQAALVKAVNPESSKKDVVVLPYPLSAMA